MKRLGKVFVVSAIAGVLVIGFLARTFLAKQEGMKKFLETEIAQKSGNSVREQRQSIDEPAKAEVVQKIKKLHMPFIANEGQMDGQVRFYANTFGGTVFVTEEGEIGYSLIKNARQFETFEADEIRNPKTEARNVKSSKAVYFKEELMGGKTHGIKGEGESVTKVSYFRGNDPSKWKTNISTYDMVSLGEVYEGVEVKLKAHGNTVEKFFYVKPGAEPGQIKLKLSGVTDCKVQNTNCEGKNPKLVVSEVELSEICNPKLSINSAGELVVKTVHGDVKFSKPVAYQEIDGKRVDVAVEYNISNPKSKIRNRSTERLRRSPKSEYGFKVASYDKTKELIIDPLLASTFLGGYGDEYIYSVTIDQHSGNLYVAGYTYSTNFPTTTGAYDISFNGGNSSYGGDAFISKFDGALTTLVASTYLGGSGNDYCFSIATDTDGNVYAAGWAESANFPTTIGSFDTTFNKGFNDAFVTKLNGELTRLLASTYLGGYDGDWANSITADSGGNVYVTGQTHSPDYPTTSGAYDTSRNGWSNYNDAFVSKLDGTLKNLLASTFFGGFSLDTSKSILIDEEGNIYISGYTAAEDLPTTTGAYDNSHNGGGNDAFISKFNGELTNLLASTFLGGSGYELGNTLTIGSDGNIYISGMTTSSDFPTTADAYDVSLGGQENAFISKISGDLTTLLASTYLGGSGQDRVESIAIDLDENVYVTGWGNSSDFPTTVGAYDTVFNGNFDVFVSKLNGNLTNLLASTFLGGTHMDLGCFVYASDKNIYVAGEAHSSDFPTTTGSYDSSFNGGHYDAFIVKFDSNLSDASTTPTPTSTPEPTVSPTPTITLNDGLAAYYPFNGNANDESGNGNHGTVYGAALAEDRFGNARSAYNFDGVNDYIKISSAKSIPTNGNRTFSLWIKYDRNNPGYSNPEVLSIGNASYFCSDGGLHAILILGSWRKTVPSAKIGLSRGCDYTPNLAVFTPDEDIGNKQWHHIVTGYDGANSFLYTDGVLRNSVKNSDYTHNASTIWIGGRRDGDTTHVNGLIDDVRIYNRTLSESEINNLYIAGTPASSVPVNTGKISGRVIDTGGNPVESVALTLIKAGKGIAGKTFSRKDCLFEFTDLEEGRYRIIARKKGYKTSRSEVVALKEGQEKEIEMTMSSRRRHVIESEQLSH